MLLADPSAQLELWLYNFYTVVKVLIGFSIIIFFHELGHFLAAKWVGIRVDRFAVGFGTRVLGYRRGEGLTFGNRPDYSADELARKGYGETDYCLRLLPIGGYVKMLGQDDLIIDDDTGEIQLSNDPRAFTSRPVGQRMIVVSAGVVFNLILAAMLLTGLFLVGRYDTPPIVGAIPPDSPAHGVLLPGDRILSVNGRSVLTFEQMLVSSIVSDGEVELEIERNGKRLRKPIRVKTERNPILGLSLLAVDVARQPVLARDALPDGDLPPLEAGDRIIAVNGRPVHNILDVEIAFRLSMGRPVQLDVERASEHGDEGKPQIIRGALRPALQLMPAEPAFTEQQRARSADTATILGLLPRRTVEALQAGSPAERAGFRPGDIVLHWGAVPNPSFSEILTSIESNTGKPIAVRVSRGGAVVRLSVTPHRRFKLFGQAKPRVGIVFGIDLMPVVADVAPDSPVAALGIPRGAQITAVDQQPVSSWADVIGVLFDHAGQKVTLQYRVGTAAVGVPLRVPSSLYDTLSLTPISRVVEIAGQKTVETSDPRTEGKKLELPLDGNPWAIRQVLGEHVGETVPVHFARTPEGQIETASFAVTADNIDPWQMRIRFAPQGLAYQPVTELIKAPGGNPITALWMGISEVNNWVFQVYAFLRSLVVDRTVSVEHVQGPVGIVNVAVERAKQGWDQLVYLMALLSVNLAVINFLPIPVMDGGLMVFLIIEKIKGKPLSLKTQMISTLVGLAAIILIGLIVTFQDISNLFQ